MTERKLKKKTFHLIPFKALQYTHHIIKEGTALIRRVREGREMDECITMRLL